MKYVMTPNQEAIVNGEYPYPGASGELLSNGKIQLIEEFLMFEHTDGLNYVHTEIAKTKYLSKYLSISDTDKIQFNALGWNRCWDFISKNKRNSLKLLLYRIQILTHHIILHLINQLLHL